jgi:hypothetical protein
MGMEGYDAPEHQARCGPHRCTQDEARLRHQSSVIQQGEIKRLIDEAVVDAYGEEEQVGGFLTMMEEHLDLPFSAKVLGVDVVVENVDMACDGQIVAACRRGKTRQKVEILDLPLPTPAPAGTEWIAAYRYWRRGF